MLIGLTGKIGSGKTLSTEYFKCKGFTEYSFAEPLKEIGKIFGFTDRQLYGSQTDKLELHEYWNVSSRKFLQKVGTELFRETLPKLIPEMNISESIWIDLFKIKVKNSDVNYIISDIRFLNEAETVKKLGGIIIKLERNNITFSQDRFELVHQSEQEIDKIKPDYIINNNGDKETLFKSIDTILSPLIINSF
jgi:dephospho-CoA kinase